MTRDQQTEHQFLCVRESASQPLLKLIPKSGPDMFEWLQFFNGAVASQTRFVLCATLSAPTLKS